MSSPIRPLMPLLAALVWLPVPAQTASPAPAEPASPVPAEPATPGPADPAAPAPAEPATPAPDEPTAPAPPAATDPLVLRTSIDPSAGIWVGQRVVLSLDILARDAWADLKEIPAFEVPGATAMRVETQGMRLSETIDGGGYSGQRHQWLLFPQRGGALGIPAISLQVQIRTFGAGAKEQILQRQTAPVGFDAKVPPGAENLPGIISTTGLTASQQWAPDDGKLRAGDGIERTISRQAAGISGMAFAPLPAQAIAGVAVYPGQPRVNDTIDRGDLSEGKRVETITYVPAKAGTFELPDIALRWWNTDSLTLHKELLKGHTLQVSPAPGPSGGGTLPAAGNTSRAPVWLYLVLLVLAAAALGLLWHRVVRPGYRAHLAVRRDREAAWLGRFEKAARSGDLHQTMKALMHWLDRLSPAGPPARLQQFAGRYGDPAAVSETEKFAAAFARGDDQGWQPVALVRAMKETRENYLKHAHARASSADPYSLAVLNPSVGLCRQP